MGAAERRDSWMGGLISRGGEKRTHDPKSGANGKGNAGTTGKGWAKAEGTLHATEGSCEIAVSRCNCVTRGKREGHAGGVYTNPETRLRS